MGNKKDNEKQAVGAVTVWQCEYDDGEVGVLCQRKSLRQGNKQKRAEVTYFSTASKAREHVTDLCRKAKISQEDCRGGEAKLNVGLEHLVMQEGDRLLLAARASARSISIAHG